jgi:hypothetical protein
MEWASDAPIAYDAPIAEVCAEVRAVGVQHGNTAGSVPKDDQVLSEVLTID